MVAHSLLPPDGKVNTRYCRRFQELVNKGLFDPELMFYSDGELYTLSGYVNSQNNRNWSTENPHAVCEVGKLKLLCGQQFSLCLSAKKINCDYHRSFVLLPFLGQMADEKLYSHFMQDNETVHTVNNSVVVLDKVFSKQVIR
jgi:hypothetical protein